MQCRHTVPDWHLYVDPAGDAVPIFAACRLLVREGELARDPHSIACGYWGHQRDCPLFDGPGAAARALPRGAERSASRDVPVATDTLWPVRASGSRDGMRLVLIGLGVVSTALMLFTAGVGLTILAGKTTPASYRHLVVVTVSVSVVTHVLATLRTWARR